MTSGGPNFQTAPVIGQSVTILPSGTGTVVTIIRYDSNGKWCCGVRDTTINATLALSVFLKASVWYGEEYIPTRYPDEDAILKGM